MNLRIVVVMSRRLMEINMEVFLGNQKVDILADVAFGCHRLQYSRKIFLKDKQIAIDKLNIDFSLEFYSQ